MRFKSGVVSVRGAQRCSVQAKEEYNINAKALIPLIDVYFAVSYASVHLKETKKNERVATLSGELAQLSTTKAAQGRLVLIAEQVAVGQTLAGLVRQITESLEFPYVSTVSEYDREEYSALVEVFLEASKNLFNTAINQGPDNLIRELCNSKG